MNTWWIALGGAVGSMTRYGVAVWFRRIELNNPWATLTVNVVGCFLLALIAEAVARGAALSDQARLALTVGFCGGLTTYSTFNEEALSWARSGALWRAGIYVIGTASLCALAGMLGVLIARSTWRAEP